MLRHTTVAELEALQHRVAELKRSSLKPEAVEETASAVALAIRQKAAQHQLELDRVRRTVLKTTVARSMQQVAGAAAEEQEGGVSYRDRARAKRARTKADLQALLSGGKLDQQLANEVKKQIENLEELDALDVARTIAQSCVGELDQTHGLAASQKQTPVKTVPAVTQAKRLEQLEQEFALLDPDRNGYIEAADLLKAINAEEERRGVDPMDAMSLFDVSFVINRLDGVGGRKDGVLELREFVAGMKNVKVAITTTAVMDRFFELRDEIAVETKAAALAENLRRDQSFKLRN